MHANSFYMTTESGIEVEIVVTSLQSYENSHPDHTAQVHVHAKKNKKPSQNIQK